MQIRVLRIHAASLLAVAALSAAVCDAQQPAPSGNVPAASGAGPAFPGQMPVPNTSPAAADFPPPEIAPWPWAPPFWPSDSPRPTPRIGNTSDASAGDWSMGDFGGRGMGGFGGDIQPHDTFRYSTDWLPTVGVRGQAADFSSFTENLSFGHPLWSDSVSAWNLSGGVRDRLIDSDAVLPLTGQIIPADLWNVNLGLRYTRLFDNGWIAGGGVSVGSASDHPFWSINEMNVGMNAMLRVPQNEHDAWMFTLMYSPTSELNFPIPGIAYSYNPSPQFHVNIGLPFQMTWRPTDDWRFEASYMLLRTVHAKAQYRLAKWLSAVAAYDWSNEAYSLVDRPELDDRFFIYDQRASMGLQTAVIRNWTAAISAGYVFDRFLYEGESFSPSSANANSISLGAGPFAALNVGARY
jgi:hypothetical protein